MERNEILNISPTSSWTVWRLWDFQHGTLRDCMYTVCDLFYGDLISWLFNKPPISLSVLYLPVNPSPLSSLSSGWPGLQGRFNRAPPCRGTRCFVSCYIKMLRQQILVARRYRVLPISLFSLKVPFRTYFYEDLVVAVCVGGGK